MMSRMSLGWQVSGGGCGVGCILLYFPKEVVDEACLVVITAIKGCEEGPKLVAPFLPSSLCTSKAQKKTISFLLFRASVRIRSL